MSDLPELEFVSWDDLHWMGFELAQQIGSFRDDLDQIVSIARGGHVLSRILSDFLDLPIFSVSIQSYTAMQQHEIKVTQEIAPELIQNHVLLVDEIVDTGKTIDRAIPYLKDLGASKVTSVALHVKPQATTFPDFYIAETDKWVIYPYEVRETVETLVAKWKESGMTQDSILNEFKILGMNEVFMKYYLSLEDTSLSS